jgi:hypothetical protein
MTRKLTTVAMLLVIGLLAACAPARPAAITRPVPATVVDDPLRRGTPGGYIVTIHCLAVDAETGQPIRNARFVIATIRGTHRSDETCEVSFPVDTAATVMVTAPGYEWQSKQIRPRFERNVVLEIKLEMTREKPPTLTPGPQA